MWIRLLTILYFALSAFNIPVQRDHYPLPVFDKVSSFDLLEINEHKNIRVNLIEKQFSLFIFLSPECPLSQNYTLTINKLKEKYSQQVNVFGIIPGNAYSVTEVAAFQKRYHTSFTILIDSKLKFTNYLQAVATPQAILLNNKGCRLYTGAIDDWVQGLGKKKLSATQHYVANAIEQTMQQQPVTIKKTKPYGCKINDY
ncbi:MAG: redoxin family protein [Ferruginibacter sp.]